MANKVRNVIMENFIYNLEHAYQDAINFTKSHYENFPVISYLIKKELRKHTAVIYQFARQADDITDEGNLLPEQRLKLLDEYEDELKKCLSGKYKNGFWFALSNTIKKKHLSQENFYNLLKAFKQDITKKRYENYNELLNYCKNSANPVGRIILELHGIKDKNVLKYSDDICTALQLTNFYQDVNIDFQKGRIYIPKDEMQQYEVEEHIFEIKENNSKFQALIKFEVERVEKLFISGRNLLRHLPFMLKIQILLTIKGGETILKKIKKYNYNVLNKRPILTKIDFAKIVFATLIKGK